MKLIAHLTFGGDCEEAFQFYQRCFGAEIVTMIRYKDTPMADQTPPDWRHKILHATLRVGDDSLYGADLLPGQYQSPAGFHIAALIADPSEAEKVFGSLSEGGKVQMPLQKTFWARAFGVVVDRYGFSWEINCEQTQEDVSGSTR